MNDIWTIRIAGRRGAWILTTDPATPGRAGRRVREVGRVGDGVFATAAAALATVWVVGLAARPGWLGPVEVLRVAAVCLPLALAGGVVSLAADAIVALAGGRAHPVAGTAPMPDDHARLLVRIAEASRGLPDVPALAGLLTASAASRMDASRILDTVCALADTETALALAGGSPPGPEEALRETLAARRADLAAWRAIPGDDGAAGVLVPLPDPGDDDEQFWAGHDGAGPRAEPDPGTHPWGQA